MIGRLFNLFVLVVIVVGGLVAYSPYATVQKLTMALENEDKTAIATYMDFDAVKAAFAAGDFAEKLGLDTGNKQDNSIGKMIANRIMGSFASAIVSPDSTIAILKDKDRRDVMGLGTDLLDLVSRGRWHGSDQFIVYNDNGQPTMLLERAGLTGWTVKALRIVN